MDNTPKNETRERIMDTAEALFMQRGYKGVRLRDIADAVGMKHASLYYYVPKGKEQLFVAVVRRSMKRHKAGMARAIHAAGDTFHDQVYAISDWLISQPPLDLARMVQSDLAEINPETAQELGLLVLTSLTEPLIGAIAEAKDKGIVNVNTAGSAAMMLITMVQNVHHIPERSLSVSRREFGRQLVDMLLNGILTREPAPSLN